MIDKARKLALNGLELIYDSQGYSNKYIDSVCKKYELKNKERAFFIRLFLGTIENTYFIDEIISNVSNVKIERIRPAILNILRMSIYQIYFLDSVPDRAAVHSAIELCKQRRFNGLTGYVNAVLRNVCTKKDILKDDILKDRDSIDRMSVTYSIPRWIIEYWQTFLEEEIIQNILKNMAKPKGVTLRINPLKTNLERVCSLLEKNNYEYEVLEELNAVYLKKSGPLEDIEGFLEGHFYVMDAASIMAVNALDIKPKDNIIDICAAPGGKGLYAATLANEGHVLLRDIYPQKTDIIKENAHSLGIDNVDIEIFNATVKDVSLKGKFDICIADLPCSGLGSIGTKPEIRYRMSREHCKSLAVLQRDILDIAKDYVRPGGKLMFSTCTISEKENEKNVYRFLEKNKDFQKIDQKSILPGESITDGFFYAIFLKNE